MTRTSPRRIPRRRDSSRQAAYTFLTNISLGTESSILPDTQRATAVTSHSVPSPYQSSDFSNVGNFEKLPGTIIEHDVASGNGRPSLQINTKTSISLNKLPHNAPSPKTQNSSLLSPKSSSIDKVEYADLNQSKKSLGRRNSLREEKATAFLTNISLDCKHSKLTHPSKEILINPIKENVAVSETKEGSFTGADMQNQDSQLLMNENSSNIGYNRRRRRSSASTLKSESSSSSVESNSTSPNELSLSRRKSHRPSSPRSNTNIENIQHGGRKQSTSLFTASSAPLGIFAILGYNDKKSKQKSHRVNLNQTAHTDINKRRSKAESFAHLLTPSNALGSLSDEADEVYYNPTYLDNPELKTEKQPSNDAQDPKSNKHRTVLSLSGFMGSLINHNTRPDIKRESNVLFRQTHPEVDPSLTLSQIRKVKAKMLTAALYEDLDLELSTVAKAYAYFEKLILKNMVNKYNRRLIGATCLLLASKVNEPKGMSYSPLLESLHKHLDVTVKEIIEQEFFVFSSLDFELYLPNSEFMPHFERIFTELDHDSKQDYLGTNPFYEFKPKIRSKHENDSINI